MKIAALQLSNLPLNETALNIYFKTAVHKKIKILLLGEYLLCDFFKQIEQIPKENLIEEARGILEFLLSYSRQYAITLITPILETSGKKLYKSIAIITKGKAIFYRAQRLMPYTHWNEAEFFDNPIPKHPKTPPTFSIGGIKFSILFGYELHFDEFWLKFKQENVDCVLIPSASTFESSLRWREILKMRAFLNSCYILRANRIGAYEDRATNCLWNFYGDSLLMNPNGEVSDCLGDREELLVGDIDKKYLKAIQEMWKFRV